MNRAQTRRKHLHLHPTTLFDRNNQPIDTAPPPLTVLALFLEVNPDTPNSLVGHAIHASMVPRVISFLHDVHRPLPANRSEMHGAELAIQRFARRGNSEGLLEIG